MSYHAKLSPSSAHRWTSCTASIDAQDGIPNENSAASMAGTMGHQLCAEVLQQWWDHGRPEDWSIDSYLGRKMLFWKTKDKTGEDWDDRLDLRGRTITAETVVDQDMIDACESAIGWVIERVRLTGAHLEIEQRVPIGHFTGEEGAGGTSDVVLIEGDTITTCDFKMGRHKVLAYEIVEPARGDVPPVMRMNLQLACYVLGAYEKFGWMFDIKRCRAVIIQPFLGHVSDFECSLDDLLEVQSWLAARAAETRDNPVFVPSKDSCHFCRAKTICNARQAAVVDLVLDGFTDAGEPIIKPPPSSAQLGGLYAALDFIAEWCDDIRKRVWDELHAGHEVVRPDGMRYRLVQGRKGDRKWADPAKAEAEMYGLLLDDNDMFTRKLVGPSAVEKLAKAKRGGPPPRLSADQWSTLQALITQEDGKMAVALETDTRPALPSSAEGFVDIADSDLNL